MKGNTIYQMKYQFSFYAQLTRTVTTKPKWWELWKSPSSRDEQHWQRFLIVLSQDEIDFIWGDKTTSLSPTTTGAKLLYKAMTGKSEPTISMVQLEELHDRPYTSEYVATNVVEFVL